MYRQEYQKGQILLIIVLVMVTTLTIGLSVAVRSITNTRTSQEASNSEKAFSAAEAGIERSLTSSTAVNGSFSNNSTYKTTLLTVSGIQFPLNNGSPILKDSPIDLWLSTYPTYTGQWSGNLTLYWGQPSDVCDASETRNTMAALEILVLSGTKANPRITHYDVDPCLSRSLTNKFTYVAPGGGTAAGRTYSFSRTIAINTGLFVRIVPLYAPALIGVKGCDAAGANCSALPAQGTVIQAVGTSDTTQRKIMTYRYYPALPAEILQYSFFVPQ